jgi:hypothetical protein
MGLPSWLYNAIRSRTLWTLFVTAAVNWAWPFLVKAFPLGGSTAQQWANTILLALAGYFRWTAQGPIGKGTNA